MRRQLSSHFLLKVKSPCVHTVAYAVGGILVPCVNHLYRLVTPSWVCLQQPHPLCYLLYSVWARLRPAPMDDVRARLRPGTYHVLVLMELQQIHRIGAWGDGSLLNALSRKCYMRILQYVHGGTLPWAENEKKAVFSFRPSPTIYNKRVTWSTGAKQVRRGYLLSSMKMHQANAGKCGIWRKDK